MSETKELKARWNAKKSELKAEYEKLKNDSGDHAKSRRKEIDEQIDDVEKDIKDGWDNASEAVSKKINQLFDKNKKS